VRTCSCRPGNPTTTAGEKRSLRRAVPAPQEGAGRRGMQLEGAAPGTRGPGGWGTTHVRALAQLDGVVTHVHPGEGGAPRKKFYVRGGDARHPVHALHYGRRLRGRGTRALKKAQPCKSKTQTQNLVLALRRLPGVPRNTAGLIPIPDHTMVQN
jgi:hypothetical protein